MSMKGIKSICYAHQVLSFAESTPDKAACIFQVRSPESACTLTYGELRKDVIARAEMLFSLGLKGKRVALIYPPGLDFVVTFLACLYSGVVAVPLNLSRNTLQFQRVALVIREADPSAVLSDDQNLPIIRTALEKQNINTSELFWLDNDSLSNTEQSDSLEPPQLEDLAFIQYTSGSTSTPKGVMVSHKNIVANQESIRKACGHKLGFMGGGWLPQFHDMGLIGQMMQPLYMGGTYVFMPPMNFIQRPRRWLEMISHYRFVSSAAPNFGYEHCVKAISDREDLSGIDLSCWKVALNGSEPVNDRTMAAFSERFGPYGFYPKAFFPCYGMAETTLFVSGGGIGNGVKTETLDLDQFQQSKRKPAPTGATVVSCGSVSEDFRVKIVNPYSAVSCLESEIGEVWIQGDGVASGYWKNEDKTQEIFGANIIGSDDGPYLRTGDLGYLSEGELFITGRIKELIIMRGRNIYPYDIERTCNEMEQGAGSTAVTSVEAGTKTLLCAIVEIRKNVLINTSDEDLKLLVRSRVMDAHDVNVDVVVIARPGDIPRTTSGKLKRAECRKMALAQLEEVSEGSL